MRELQIYKAFIKYLTLLLKCLDIDKAKDDGRKIGLTLMGTGFLGIILEKTNVFPGLFLILFGGYLWYLGIAKREENE